MLWSLGKDSNVMVWLAFDFFGRIPFPLVHVDTEKKFKKCMSLEINTKKKWKLNLIKGEDWSAVEKIDPSLPPAARSAARKTEGLKKILLKHNFKGVIAGIRRDEQGTRAKERIFSPRDETEMGCQKSTTLNFGISLILIILTKCT